MDEDRGSQRVTELLERARAGDSRSAAELLPLVYEELKAVAQRAMAGERAGHTLQATALVHEAYVRLVGSREFAWDHRGHFFMAAAEAMRRVLIEHARSRSRLKRGGGPEPKRRVDLDVVALACGDNFEEFLSFEEAFQRLSEQMPDIADVARLRLFAGLSVEQTAEALRLSPATVKRRWTLARAWLERESDRNA